VNNGMKVFFAILAPFAVKKGVNRKVRKGRKEKTSVLSAGWSFSEKDFMFRHL